MKTNAKLSFALTILCLLAVTAFAGCTEVRDEVIFTPPEEEQDNCIDTPLQKGGCEEQLEEICFYKTSYFHKQCWENLESMLQELTPEDPTNLRQASCEGPAKPNTVCLAWSASPSEVQSYLVYEHTSNVSYTVARVDGINTSVMLHDVPTGSHTYSVIAENDGLMWNGTYHLLESNYSNEVDAYSFSAAPSGVQFFTLELEPTTEGCSIHNGLVQPPNAGSVWYKWYLHTGNGEVGIPWTIIGKTDSDGNLMGGQETMVTNDGWKQITATPEAHKFCMVALNEPAVVALALVVGESG